MEMSYEAISLKLVEATGRQVTLTAFGHVGVEVVGFWDEVLVDAADVVQAHPFADRCLASINERLGAVPPATGSVARNRMDYSTLVVTFSDGARLICAAAEFVIDVPT
jgi:hypothetical protein